MPIANVEDSDEYWSAEEEVDDGDWSMDVPEQTQSARSSRREPRANDASSHPDSGSPNGTHAPSRDGASGSVVPPAKWIRGSAQDSGSINPVTPFKRRPPKPVGTPASRVARMQELRLEFENNQSGSTAGRCDDAESIASTQPPSTEFTTRSPLSASWSATSFTSTLVDDSLSPSPSFNKILPSVTSRPPQSPTYIDIAIQVSTKTNNHPKPKPTPPTRANSLEFCIGRDLESCIIAHSDNVQQLLDKHNISWGVQYELARGITNGTWDWSEIEGKISRLVGTNAESAHQVSDIIRDRPRRDVVHNLAIWQELDREQLAIMENRSRGLGLMGEWHGDPDWHGGRIQQIARLHKVEGSYEIRLEPLEKRRSHYYARCHGSRRIIQLRIPDALLKSDMNLIRDFMCQKFILLGRVFVSFVAKEGSMYLVETSEEWRRKANPLCGDQYRISFHEFVQQHNPLDLNGKSPIRKWITRFVIGLSNSVPVLEFDPQDIHFTEDDLAPLGICSDINDPPPEMIMTDGCGFINEAAAIIIARKISMSSRPTAVQGRCMGSKGLWIIHPSDSGSQPKIWIRKSQKKINHPESAGRYLRIFNLLRTSHPPAPTQISNQSILNMSHNGVPFEVLEKFLVDGLDDLVTPFLGWDKPQSTVLLWNAINKAGSVSRSRIQRIAADFSRVLGYTGHGYDRDEDSDVLSSQDTAPVDMDDQAYIVQSGRKPHSGIPVTLHETALELVQAGFHPASSPYLRGKIGYIIEQAIKSVTEKCRIPLPDSFSAFIVPDPLGILEENQVYFRSSQPLKDPKTERLFDVVTGEVLLGRYPIRIPSDMQKVTAVDIPELREWTDVLVVSTQGARSLASLLSGGDCDGDFPFVIMHPEIVEPFQNQEFTDMPPKFFEENFQDTRDIEKVPAFLKRISGLPPRQAAKAFQNAVLFGLDDAQVGLYSNFHDYSVWKHGYSDLKSVRLAYMFATLLDSSKSGHRLKEGIFEKDRRKFGDQIPEPQASQTSQKPAMEPHSGYILHKLAESAQKRGKAHLDAYASLFGPKTTADPHLIAPYEQATAFAANCWEHGFKLPCNEMTLIRQHVYALQKQWAAACQGKSQLPAAVKKKSSSKGNHAAMVATTRTFHERMPDISIIPNVKEILASLAFKESEPFAFEVAFQDLCMLKARSSPGGIAPLTRQFDECRTIPSSYLRAIARHDEDQV